MLLGQFSGCHSPYLHRSSQADDHVSNEVLCKIDRKSLTRIKVSLNLRLLLLTNKILNSKNTMKNSALHCLNLALKKKRSSSHVGQTCMIASLAIRAVPKDHLVGKLLMKTIDRTRNNRSDADLEDHEREAARKKNLIVMIERSLKLASR